MTVILFYGNCQTKALLDLLNFSSDYEKISINCYDTKISKTEFTKIIEKSDIIITQPISEHYRNTDYLSTQYIIENRKYNAPIFILDSCYFNFYHFDLTYYKINDEILKKPIDYHYQHLIDCYKNNHSINYYLENYLNNIDLKSKKELEDIAIKNINELENRFNIHKKKYINDNIYVISTIDYIKKYYKHKLLFYSMNHPSKYILQNIAEQILNILNLPTNIINYNIDPLDNPKCIIYKCIQKVVYFDINQYTPLLSNLTNNKDIIQFYFDTYKSIELK
jgi:hypothetical protein